jgi:hypothetical protein
MTAVSQQDVWDIARLSVKMPVEGTTETTDEVTGQPTDEVADKYYKENKTHTKTETKPLPNSGAVCASINRTVSDSLIDTASDTRKRPRVEGRAPHRAPHGNAAPSTPDDALRIGTTIAQRLQQSPTEWTNAVRRLAEDHPPATIEAVAEFTRDKMPQDMKLGGPGGFLKLFEGVFQPAYERAKQ